MMYRTRTRWTSVLPGRHATVHHAHGHTRFICHTTRTHVNHTHTRSLHDEHGSPRARTGLLRTHTTPHTHATHTRMHAHTPPHTHYACLCSRLLHTRTHTARMSHRAHRTRATTHISLHADDVATHCARTLHTRTRFCGLHPHTGYVYRAHPTDMDMNGQRGVRNGLICNTWWHENNV